MRWIAALAAVVVVAAACGDGGSVDEPPLATTTEAADESVVSFPLLGEPVDIPELPALDTGSVAAGQVLYAAHCAVCHGIDLAGDANWMTPNEDGSYPPPPQDASGHTWHHSDQLLVRIVLDGSDFPQSKMPAFAGVLTEEEVHSILDYFKSTWGPQERDVQWSATVREAAQPAG